MSSISKDLYVKNLSFDTIEDDLKNLFSVCGTVTYIHLVKDPQSGKSKGCAYIKMSKESEAKDAIPTLDGAMLDHRIIGVEQARPRTQGSAAPRKRSAKKKN